MHIILETDELEDWGATRGTIYPVLAIDKDDDDVLIDVPLGAFWDSLTFTVISTDYDSSRHRDGKYAWIHKNNYSIFEESLTNRTVCKALLSEEEY